MRRAIRIARRAALVAAVCAAIERWFYVPTPRQCREDWKMLSAAIEQYRESHV